MGVRSIIKRDEKGRSNKLEELVAKVRPVIKKLREIEIVRVRGSKSEELEQGVEVDPPTDAEDAGEVARAAAEEAWKHAIDDADGKRRRYLFRLLGEAIPNEKPPKLGEVEIVIESDDGDGADLSQRGENALWLRETREFFKSVATEFVNVMKAASGSITALQQVAQTGVQAGADADGKKWDYLLKKVEYAYKADERGAELLVAQERSRQSNQTWRVAITELAPVVEVLIETFGGVVPEKARPTEAEVRLIFGDEQGLIDLGLQLIDPKNQEHQTTISQAFQVRWKACTDEVRNACVLRAMNGIPRTRLIMLAAWIKAVTGLNIKNMAA